MLPKWRSEERESGRQLIQVFQLLHYHYDADYPDLLQKVDKDVTRGNSLKLKTIRALL